VKYRVTVQSALSQKGGKPDRILEAGDVVADLTPAEIKGLKANGALEPATGKGD